MANYYVRKSVSVSGDGLTPETAFNNVREATFAVAPGDVVYIGPGVYQDDPILLRRAGEYNAYILWVGDPMGEVTGDAAGPVKVEYFDCGYFDSRYNGIWFIDFYGVVPSWLDDQQIEHGGGMSARLEMNEGGSWGDPYAPKGMSNRFSGIYFVSCKFASAIWILNRWNDKPRNRSQLPDERVFFRQVFLSCVIGYDFPFDQQGWPTIYYRNWATEGGQTLKHQSSGLVCFYGCTILAAPSLINSWMIQCFSNRADTLSSPPWPPNTPKFSLSLSMVNCILDLTSSQWATNKIYRYIGKSNTASFNVKLTGAFNIFRVPGGSGDFSVDYADLSDWQDDSITEIGDVQVYIDPADDKVKFSLTTEEEFEDGIGYVGGGTVEVVHNVALVKDTWYHCAASWDRPTGEMKINIDGAVTSDTLRGMLSINGIEGSWGGSYFMDRALRGLLDEIRVWNEVRSNADIDTYKDQVIDPDDFPELYRQYKCNEGSGALAIDFPNTSNKSEPLPPVPRDARLEGITYSTDIPFGIDGYSLQCGQDSAMLMGKIFPVDQPEGDYPDTTSSFTVEFWFKLDDLASNGGQNVILMTKGARRVDAESIYKDENDDIFENDGWHLKAGASPIDSGMPFYEDLNREYSGNVDVEGDSRPQGDEVDIGADEYTALENPDHLNPYGFTSKVYGFIQDGRYPPKCWVDFDYNQDITEEGAEVCGNVAPEGGWKDELRILISFRPMEENRWIEVLNTETEIDKSGTDILIPYAARGPHFQVKFEVYPHAEHLKKFDLGFGEDGFTETISQNQSRFKYPPGCILDIYNLMFKQLVNRTVVKADGTWSVAVWPGTYYIIPHGQTDKMDKGREFITVGFSDWFTPFGKTNCAIPFQTDWAEFENEFMGTTWASWYAQEQFIDEVKRISTELPDSWPYEPYQKRMLVRCGRLIKGESWFSGFRIYAGPSLNLEGYDLMENIEMLPNFQKFGSDPDFPDIWDNDNWVVT